MQVITSADDLAEACAKLAANAYLTIDTEFMRESTFWPKLCLIQMAGDGIEVIVDPLADGINLDPFYALMGDEKVVKVFHAARQDVEIVHHQAGIVPHPIFDTQVAATVCGFGDSISYSNLVKKILGIDIDKSSRFTDWQQRPLSDKQLTYALGDVTHLRSIYERLDGELSDSGRSHWLAEEMAVLTNPATYEAHPENAWKRMKLKVKNRKALAILMELAEWRERRAQDRDMPRNRVIREEAILDIANQAPKSVQALARLRSCNEGFARSARGRDVLEAVQRGLARDPDTLPPLRRNVPLPPEATAVMDLLRVLLKAAAARNAVAQKIIATTDDLEKIAVDDGADVPALNGWRRELFGNDALALKRGELALAVRNGEVTVFSPVKSAAE